ncbi:hypothetical protein SPI_04476 [Niveomyces insectorum RCEF 264]|uniref:DUF4336 domain-containing protein n=1 Tax=Niveomyces insectorum RCEF 264 TaxID=1081102 RepID=A0A167UIQ4_9HYPO|nr:hypothetical protein SPI_04476 [Niveomyces insectorum RCEF 264]
MSTKLIPSNPADVMVIRDLTPNVITLSVPFSRFGLVEVGGRCTVVRMTGGGVMVYSPVAYTPEAAAAVKRLDGGQGVKYLVAPDLEHHIFLSEWARAYPGARLIGPQGLPEKRTATKGANPKIRVDDAFFAVLADNRTQPPYEPQPIAPDFDADFALVYVDVHPNKEIVLLYRPEGILIEADLLFNLPAVEQYARVDAAARRGGPDHSNLLNRMFQYFTSTDGAATGPRRFQWYLISRGGNRARFNEAVRAIDSWPFDTIIPCHGEIVQSNGKEVFRKVFAWHLLRKKDK